MTATPGQRRRLTPEAVRQRRFTPVRLRGGYDMAEVDQLLDDVEAELTRCSDERGRACPDCIAEGDAAPVRVTADQIEAKRFTPVRLREGYDMDEVDLFLDDVQTELDRLVAENRRACARCRS